MRFKTTFVIFIIFLILLVLVYFFEFTGKRESDEEEKLLALSSEDIQKISFKKENGVITFQKEKEGEWLITEPLEAKADEYVVDRLADNFSDLKIERLVEEEPENLEKYKIPQKEILLWFKDQEEPVKILIGMENPLDKTFFAKRADETKVVLIPSHLKNMMEKSVFDFRQKDIFKFDTNEVKSIKLRAKKTQWEASKQGEEWFFKKPVKALAKTSKIDDILRSLSNLKANEFISEEKESTEITKYGLDRPEYDITLIMPLANKEIRFSFCKEEDKLIATTSHSSKIIAAEDALLSDLEKEAKELREKEVANFNSWEVNKIYVKMRELVVKAAEGEEDKWYFESKERKEADRSKIQTFIRKIESLEAKEFIDSPSNIKDYGLETPQGEIKLWIKENEEKSKEITIHIGIEDKEAKTVVVRNPRFKYLFRVDSSFMEDFPKEIKDWEKEENNQD